MRRASNPSYIAFISSVITSVFVALGMYIALGNEGILTILGISGLSLLVGFLVYYYFLQRFIYQKIKFIYKNIYRFKSSSKKENSLFDNFGKDPIDEVEKEVVQWMRDNRRELDKLKEEETFRKEFLGNVSHELKTPIQSIQGYIHTLLDGALEDKKVNRNFLEKAGKSTDRLVHLVNELTSISNLQSNNPGLDYSKFDVVKLINDVVEMVSDLALTKNISIVFKKGSPMSHQVYADKSKIEQVLTNLIVNAIKYGKKNGEVKLGIDSMGENSLIEISDDGSGIEEEHIPRLFERFYRTDTGRSRNEGGSGLGLAIVKHIIEAHNQTINVRSTIGQGSTFGFTLQGG